MTEPAITLTKAAPPADFAWGMTLDSSRERWTGSARRRVPAAAAAAALLLEMLLGIAGATVASSSPAQADVLGISSTVQDWICGIVAPSEPWEGVGDGPESWMSNLNLAKVKPAPAKVVDTKGTIHLTPASSTLAPSTMDQLTSVPPGTYTLYEIAGLRGLSWWTIPLNTNGSRNCSLWNYVWSQSGNLTFTINKTALQIVISIKEAASAEDPLSFLYDASGGVMSTVFTLVFVPIAALMLLATAIWLGIQSARGNHGLRAALGGVGATFGIIALAAFLYTAVNSVNSGQNGFRGIARIADEGISAVNAVATNGMFNTLAQNTGSCSLPADNTSATRGQRITSCVMADALAYRPWEIGQFGGAGANPIPLPAGWTAVMPGADGTIPAAALKGQKTLPCYVNFDKCADLRTYLIAQHGGIQLGGNLNGHQGYLVCAAQSLVTVTVNSGLSWLGAVLPVFGALDNQTFTIDTTSVCSPMFRTFIVLANTDPQTADAYSGNVGIARVSQALSSLIGTAVAGIAVLVISLITMCWQAMTFSLYITGAFKLAFAVYSGKIKIAREWFGDIVYSWAARLAYGIVLNLTILMIVWMLSSTINFGMRLVWLGVILFMFFKLIQKVQEMIKPSASALRVDPVKTAKDVGRRTRRASIDGTDGIRDTLQRRKYLAADPTRGKTRRTVSAIAAPLTVLGGGLRGAATGSTGAERRNRKAIVAAVTSRNTSSPTPNRPPSGPTHQTGPHNRGVGPGTQKAGVPVRTGGKTAAPQGGTGLVKDVATPRVKAPTGHGVASKDPSAAGTRSTGAVPVERRTADRAEPPTSVSAPSVDDHPTELIPQTFGRHGSDTPTQIMRREAPDRVVDSHPESPPLLAPAGPVVVPSKSAVVRKATSTRRPRSGTPAVQRPRIKSSGPVRSMAHVRAVPAERDATPVAKGSEKSTGAAHPLEVRASDPASLPDQQVKEPSRRAADRSPAR